jgi:ubiquinone/menaquinone biosynthesis C-methylase UbiE
MDSWLPDELRHAGREHLDPDHAARYDRKEDAGAAVELELLAEYGIGRGSSVVDFGAGTGQFAMAASKLVRHVTAVDVSEVMLGRLREKVDSSGARNVSCVLAGFLSYRHETEPVDLVYTRYALHHLPDFWKAIALDRMAGVLRPGGILRLWDVVYNFQPGEAIDRLESWMSGTLSNEVEDGWTRPELEEHVRDENSTFTWLLEPMIERAGFRIERADYSDDGIFARYICVKPATGGSR